MLIKNSTSATVCSLIKADLIYIAPPYNYRQYSDTYHLLENVARWEKPPCKVYAFNNQIRFNNAGEFNFPVDKKDFNESLIDSKFTYEQFLNMYLAYSGIKSVIER